MDKTKFKNLALHKFFLPLIASLSIGCGENQLDDRPSAYEMASNDYTYLPEEAINSLADSILEFNFDWLSSTDDDLERKDHSAASTICGWIVPNYLDNTILIFSSQGAFLGAIRERGRWDNSLPGTLNRAEEIINPYLRKLTTWIITMTNEDQGFMLTLMKNLEEANIESTNFQSTTTNSISILMGQPLAIVRASVELTLKQSTSIFQSKDTFKEDLKNQDKTSTTSGFKTIKAPFQLGSRHKTNDGLISFWIEDFSVKNDLSNIHYNTADSSSFKIQTTSSKETSYKSEIKVLMLTDPRYAIHASVGELPVKVLQLPSKSINDMLASIQVSFTTAPQSLENRASKMPLPGDSGHEWSWKDTTAETAWNSSDLSRAVYVSKKELEKVFPNQVEVIWKKLIDNKSILPLEGEVDNALITLSKSSYSLLKIAPRFHPELEAFLRSKH